MVKKEPNHIEDSFYKKNVTQVYLAWEYYKNKLKRWLMTELEAITVWNYKFRDQFNKIFESWEQGKKRIKRKLYKKEHESEN